MANEASAEKTSITAIFGCNVFNDSVMREMLPEKVYRELRDVIDNGVPMRGEIADTVADTMKNWAVARGATHFTHWFQPLTGVTAEKHDGFITPDGNGHAIMSFSGGSLIKGEPDASSFPSGGLRATFEARGYTAWDCTSPAFLKEDRGGVTLCIPTAFCSYTGEALDKKTPLLRSCEALSKQALRVLRAFGDDTTTKIITTVGAEQEYFLIDKDSYEAREDLKVTGRTLFGAKPPKGQEMDDHYYGTIKERVAAYMHDLDMELYKLGVFSKTKHNEVAPCQHELACIYCEANIATDHNQLVMETMKRVAKRHNLVCLLHEKPFKGLNGSGKHNNWAISTDSGENLLKPGKTPHENTRFLLFLSAIIEAIDLHADILRASAANVGNDHRLGGNEAPPCVISIYLGDELTDILDGIASGTSVKARKAEDMTVGVSTVPSLHRDTTDRNRTSPFAFTGNKFEFRMVGSSASIAGPNTVLGTAVADSLMKIADRLEKCDNANEEAKKIICEIIKEHSRIIFNGNGYSKEWREEAARRGLSNVECSLDSYGAYTTPKAIEMFARHGVYSETELNARYEIKVEKYVKVTNIEALTMLDMAFQRIIPAVGEYTANLSESISKIEGAHGSAMVERALLERITPQYEELYRETVVLEKAVNELSATEDIEKAAVLCRDRVLPTMEKVRAASDLLEQIVAKDYWPIPTYSDILFY